MPTPGNSVAGPAGCAADPVDRRQGVQKGIENAVRWMMPGLAVLLLILVGYAVTSGGFDQGFAFLFSFDTSKITGEALLAALGHAFFTLSLASGAILTYGSYIPDDPVHRPHHLYGRHRRYLCGAAGGPGDLPIIFANGMDPTAGPGLIFHMLPPLAFQQMPFGTAFGVLFFAMVSIAALTSAISMIEATVAYLNEKHGISRMKAAIGSGAVLLVISMLAMLSFNLLSGWTPMGKNFFDWLDYLTSRWMMPLGGILIVLLAGYALRSEIMRDELNLPPLGYALWLFMVRYVCPVLILMVFLHALGWLASTCCSVGTGSPERSVRWRCWVRCCAAGDAGAGRALRLGAAPPPALRRPLVGGAGPSVDLRHPHVKFSWAWPTFWVTARDMARNRDA